MSSTRHSEEDFSIYGGKDPRDLPAYSIEIAASWLLMAKSTLKTWVFGASWIEKDGTERSFKPLIKPPDPTQQLLSFVNLVEIHVIKSLRRTHKLQMIKVRDAIEHLKDIYETQHPLADIDLLAGKDGVHIDDFGLLNVSSGKQVAMDFLKVYLSRIDRSLLTHPSPHYAQPAVKLYPFVVPPRKIGKQVISPDDRRMISIYPLVYFGRPVIDGTGIPTEAIADRFWGGDSIDDRIEDFGRTKLEIEYALKYEHAQDAA
jgi:uncharacterized protein (DUF433 family)